MTNDPDAPQRMTWLTESVRTVRLFFQDRLGERVAQTIFLALIIFEVIQVGATVYKYSLLKGVTLRPEHFSVCAICDYGQFHLLWLGVAVVMYLVLKAAEQTKTLWLQVSSWLGMWAAILIFLLDSFLRLFLYLRDPEFGMPWSIFLIGFIVFYLLIWKFPRFQL